MFVKSLSFLLALLAFLPAADLSPAADESTAEESTAPLEEKDLLGLYLQANTGTLLEFHAKGKLSGWPTGGSYKIVGPHRVEITQMIAGKEERLPVEIMVQKEGLIMVRNVNGENETVPLHRLQAVKFDAKAWQGDCMVHVLLSGPKLATRREAKLMEDGYIRTPEGGYWLRLLQDPEGKKTLGFSSNLEDQTLAVSLYKAGSLLVVFDQLEKPTLLSIIQLSVK